MDNKSDNQILSQSVSLSNIKATEPPTKDSNISSADRIDESKKEQSIDKKEIKGIKDENNLDKNLKSEQQSTTTEQNPYNSISFSLEDIFINLTLLARIDVGNKLIRYEKYINIDTSYFQAITRWFNGQNRSDNIKFMTAILSKAFEYSDALTKQKDDESRQNLLRLNTALSNASNGLSNLSQTYYYDKLAQSEIEVMINNIRTKLNIQSKHIQFVDESKEKEKENRRDSLHDLKQVVVENIKRDKKEDKREDRREDRREDKREERRESEKSEKREHDDHSHSSHLSHSSYSSHSSHLKKKSL
jgi:hypothetical protein